MSKLPGPTMDEVPGEKPAAGITRTSLTDAGFGGGRMSGSVPETMANEGMDTDYPTEGRRRRLDGTKNLR